MKGPEHEHPAQGPSPSSVWVGVYTAAIVVAALVSLGVGWVIEPLQEDDVVPVLVFLGMGLVSALLRDRKSGAAVSLSFTGVVTLAAVALVGPVGAGLMGLVSPLVDRRWRAGVAVIFNAAMASFIGSLAGLTYLFASGVHPTAELDPTALLIHVGGPLLAANVVHVFVNGMVLTGMIRITRGDSTGAMTEILRSTAPLYLGYTVLSFLFVVLWVPAGVGPLSAALLMAPLLVARWVFEQYGDEMRAHQRILDTLVSAGEATDGVGRAHGRRVDRYATVLATRLGLAASERRHLQYAAVLHDIGKVAMPPTVLRNERHDLTEDDLDAIVTHPDVAAEIVEGVGFLAGAVPGIRHHHERVDGQGYPAGLAGDEIPMAARIIGVCDAYDGLTQPTGNRPALSPAEAMTQLRLRAGSQLDGRLVDALAHALDDGDLPALPNDDAPRPPSIWVDHDDPEISEVLARRRTLHRRRAG